MTHEEAINTLKVILEEATETEDSICYVTSGDADALKAAIQALEQQPCENCIGQEALINELKLGYFNKELQEAKNDACVIDAMIDWAIRTVKRQPSVTPKGVTVTDFADRCRECGKTKTGHWIKTGDYYTGAYGCLDYFECSCCHEESLEEGDFCPNCGADMRGDTDETN